MTEWIDLGGQYYNDLSDGGSGKVRLATLSEATFRSAGAADPAGQLRDLPPAGRQLGASQTASSFASNRFILTGSPEGDYNVTLTMISDTCNAPSNALLAAAVDRAAPGGRDRADDRAARRRQRQLHDDRELDRNRLPVPSFSTTYPPHRPGALAVGAARRLLAISARGCGCGGGPFGNPPTIENPGGAGGQKLSFTYFQKCITPILQAQLQVDINGVISTNSCAGSGCHDSVNGTGGALRVVPNAADVDLTDPANTPDVIRASDMYKNFFSSQGVVIPGAASEACC